MAGLAKVAGGALIALSAFVSACVRHPADEAKEPDRPSIPVQGSVADVRTPPGDNGGYVVSRSCRDPSCIGIDGATGERHFVGGPRLEMEPLRSAILIACRNVRSTFSSGVTAGCLAGTAGLVFWMYDWREVDSAIACIGRTLVELESGDSTAVCLSAKGFATDL